MLAIPCDVPDCSAATRPGGGGCRMCHRSLCKEHYMEKIHNCWKEDYDPIQNLIATDNMWERFSKILETLDVFKTAETLRPGRTVTPIELKIQNLPRGARNTHVPIDFDDGVKWIARIRRVGVNMLPRLLERQALRSEMDTMRWLHEGGIPAAKVVSDIFTHGETDFFFMEVLPGTACETPIFSGKLERPVINHIIEDLAKINIRLSERPFHMVGSLHYDPTQFSFTVGPLISPISATDTQPFYPGPFQTSGDKWRYHLDHAITEVEVRETHQDQPETAILIYRWIREVVSGYSPFNEENQESFVVNEDANGSHIMVDDAGHITGLIDWEWATVGAKCEAFCAPMGLVENGTYYAGSNELSYAEIELIDAYKRLGRPDLAEQITKGKPYQWLTGLVGGQEWREYKYLKAFAESVGVEIEDTQEEFLASQRVKQAQVTIV